jgi:hypothetical protein
MKIKRSTLMSPGTSQADGMLTENQKKLNWTQVKADPVNIARGRINE